jgi:hypothetical protein
VSSLEIKEHVPIKGHYDVIVAGGGLAGVAAAVSARRNGCRTLLLEKTNLLGGLATIGLVNLFVPMCNGRGKQIIFGMAEELLRLSAKNSYHTIPKEWIDGEPKEPTKVRYVQRFCPQIFALELTKWVMDAGVDLLFDCVCSQPVMDGNHCRGIITESKSGREFYEAGMVIDATGDADIIHRAGVPTVEAGNFFTYYAFGVNLKTCKKASESGFIRDIYKTYGPGHVNLYGKGQPDDVPLFKGTSVEDVTRYITTFQRRLLGMLENDVPHEREIVTMPTMPQLRTTRRIDGDYTLTVDDAYKHFDDSVGAIGDFERRDFLYEIPYRTMTRQGFDNLITVGRCVAGEGYAWDVLRVIPPAILTGEVAGMAAALALESEKSLPEVEMGELQKRIVKAGIMLHFDDSLIPADDADAGGKVEGFDHM